jgi:hypothetical protein
LNIIDKTLRFKVQGSRFRVPGCNLVLSNSINPPLAEAKRVFKCKRKYKLKFKRFLVPLMKTQTRLGEISQSLRSFEMTMRLLRSLEMTKGRFFE